jgi:hypothetical protein
MAKPEKDRPGRQDDGQEATIKMETLITREKHLISLYNKANETAKDYSDAVKKVAEDAGLLTVNVRKYISAKAGDDFDEAKRKVIQLSLIFEEADPEAKK